MGKSNFFAKLTWQNFEIRDKRSQQTPTKNQKNRIQIKIS